MKPRKLLPPLLALLLLAACGRNTPQANNASALQIRQNNGIQLLQAQNGDPRTAAAHLEDLAKRIPQVQNARCIVIGGTAIVGIDVKPDLPRAQVDTVKYAVAEALKKDPAGVNALVTADIDLGQRIREMSDDISRGRPVGGFADELGDIIGRIMPQFPRDTAKLPAQPPANNQPQAPAR